MLRSLLMYLSRAAWMNRLLTGWGFSRRAAARFVAGETLEDALRVVAALNEKGIYATLDQLGEHILSIAEANRATDGILVILDEIRKADLCANVSIKLTQIGLEIDKEACRANLTRILQKGREVGNFVRIDMENSPYTEKTLALYNQMRQMGYAASSVGLVVQAYLYHAEQDLHALLENGTHFRLVKGAYDEPPSLAFPKKADVDANYDRLTHILLDASLTHLAETGRDGRVPPLAAIATHDEKRIVFARGYAKKIGLSESAMEFQMLYGIRRDLQEKLVCEGYPVRVYVPFGKNWAPYFMRRLAERPANLWFFVSNLFKK